MMERMVRCAVNVNAGTAQVSPQGYQTRYYLKVEGRERIMSVPRRHTGTLRSLNETEINNGPGMKWRDDHIKLLRNCYGRSPFFKDFFEPVADLISTAEGMLGPWNERTTLWAMGVLRLQTRWVQDTDLVPAPARPEHPSDWVLALCREGKATAYYTGKVASDAYMKFPDFEAAGIRVVPQDWTCPPYVQTKGDFVPNLCVLDALFNLGVEGTRQVIGLEQNPA